MVWMGFMYKATFRAMIEITMGGIAYELSGAIRKRALLRKEQNVLSFLEALLFIGCVVSMTLTWDKKFEVYILFALFVLLSLSGSGATFWHKIFDNKLIYFLGEFSFPIYLSQLTAIYIVTNKMNSLPIQQQVWLSIGITLLVASFVWTVDKRLKRLKNMRRQGNDGGATMRR